MKKLKGLIAASLAISFALAGCKGGGQVGLGDNDANRGVGLGTPDATEATVEDASTATVEDAGTATPEADEIQLTEEALIHYKAILQANKTAINQYNFQFGLNYVDDDTMEPGKDPEPIAFADINGDDVPELFYMFDDEGLGYMGKLSISTYVDGEVKEVYNEVLDAVAASGTTYCLFKTDQQDGFILYSAIGDEGYDYTYSHFALPDGELVQDSTLIKSEMPNEDYSVTTTTYTLDGNELTEAQGEEMIGQYLEFRNEVILYNDPYSYILDMDHEIEDAFADTAIDQMSYDDAMDFIDTMTEDSEAANTKDANGIDATLSAFFETDPGFWFSSGAGAWSTDITLHKDGSFDGAYHDSDMGITGPGYPNGTIYTCEFTGRFTDFKKIDDYTYEMTLKDLTETTPTGTEEIIDEILYSYTGPSGFDGGTKFEFYLPGKPISEISEECMNWNINYMFEDDKPDTLESYCIYNVDDQTAFFQ